MKVNQLMQKDVVTVGPDASLKDVAAALVEHRISGMPVCDAEGHVLGVISKGDILYKERGRIERTGGPLAWLVDGGDRRGDPRRCAPVRALALARDDQDRRPQRQGGARRGLETRLDAAVLVGGWHAPAERMVRPGPLSDLLLFRSKVALRPR